MRDVMKKNYEAEIPDDLIGYSLVWFICLMTYQLFMGYLMMKFVLFVNVWLEL